MRMGTRKLTSVPLPHRLRFNRSNIEKVAMPAKLKLSCLQALFHDLGKGPKTRKGVIHNRRAVHRLPQN